MHLKTSSAKWRPFCPGGDELSLLPLHKSHQAQHHPVVTILLGWDITIGMSLWWPMAITRNFYPGNLSLSQFSTNHWKIQYLQMKSMGACSLHLEKSALQVGHWDSSFNNKHQGEMSYFLAPIPLCSGDAFRRSWMTP